MMTEAKSQAEEIKRLRIVLREIHEFAQKRPPDWMYGYRLQKITEIVSKALTEN
jgi:hypothetical protein